MFLSVFPALISLAFCFRVETYNDFHDYHRLLCCYDTAVFLFGYSNLFTVFLFAILDSMIPILF